MTPDTLQRVSEFWGDLSGDPRLIGHRENAVFEARFRNGIRAALRLHRRAYQSPAAIEAELAWTELLADAGFPCPRPIRTRDGALLVQYDGQCASLISWINADCIGATGRPFVGTPKEQQRLYHQLGGVLRDLHRQTDALNLPPLPRKHWDIDGLFGASPIWGCPWDNPSLTAAEAQFLQDVSGALGDMLHAMPHLDFGLIHADALQENVLARDGKMWLIDFDDSGYGYRAMDLGAALIQHVFAPNLPQLSKALLEGYGDPDLAPLLPTFTLLRALTSAAWIAPRAPVQDPKQRAYADRALTLARAWLATLQ